MFPSHDRDFLRVVLVDVLGRLEVLSSITLLRKLANL